MQYDAVGNVVAEVDELGRTTRYFYDALNRRIRTELPLVAAGTPILRYTYDAAGNLTKATDTLGRDTGYAYDGNNRMVEMTDAAGGVSSTVYDKVGNVVALVDALGRTSTHSYDALNRLESSSLPAPGGAGSSGPSVT